jgi:serine/threonine-protein kinase CLA4
MLLLADITSVDRTDLRPYCLLIETRDRKIHLSFKSDDEVYGWKDDIYARSPLMGFSNPVNFVHKIHVGFDPNTGNFTVSIYFSLSGLERDERALSSYP